mgnify:FL=1
MIAINDFAQMAINISGKTLKIKNIEGPEGVRGRNSDNALFQEKMGWSPSQPLLDGMINTYLWISSQISGVDFEYDDGVKSLRKVIRS